MTNFISSNSIEAKHGSPLPEESRFACLPGCGLCCSYRVLVTESDQQRLQAAGACVTPPEPWEAANGELALRRTPDLCLFLDPQQRCTVYDHRPVRCRAYPYLWTTYAWQELDVDLSCPGLGHGDVAPPEWCQPPAEGAARRSQRERAIGEIQGLLCAQRRYAAPKVLAALGGCCLDELAADWPVMTICMDQVRPLFVNAQTKDDLLALWQELCLLPQPVGELLADAVFIERHFAHPRWNTRLGPEGKVTLYRFWVDESILRVKERDGTRREIPLDNIGQLPWQPEALLTRRAYLERWLKRQLPVRLANNLAVASPMPGSHIAIFYLEFLVEIDWRLAVLAPALARVSGKGAIDHGIALEAIRGSDGLLRAWCQSARLGATNGLDS